jgi:hypothetical protein
MIAADGHSWAPILLIDQVAVRVEVTGPINDGPICVRLGIPRPGGICRSDLRRNASTLRSQLTIWFQLANVRVTTSSQYLPTFLRLPDRKAIR